MTVNNVKLWAAILLIVAIIVCILYFVRVLSFEQSAVLLLGDIAAYPTGAAVLT